MSLVQGSQGFLYTFNDNPNKNEVTRNIQEKAYQAITKLPIPSTVISSSVSRSLLETIYRSDPNFALFLERNTNLLDLLDASLSKAVKGSLVSNFIRENPGLDNTTINKLVSLSQDLPFFTQLNRPSALNSSLSLALERLNRIGGSDFYRRLVDQNLVSTNLQGILSQTLRPADIAKFKQEGVSPEQLSRLMSIIMPLEPEQQILQQIQQLWSQPAELPLPDQVIGTLPAETTENAGGQTNQPETDVFVSGNNANTMNLDSKISESTGKPDTLKAVELQNDQPPMQVDDRLKQAAANTEALPESPTGEDTNLGFGQPVEPMLPDPRPNRNLSIPENKPLAPITNQIQLAEEIMELESIAKNLENLTLDEKRDFLETADTLLSVIEDSPLTPEEFRSFNQRITDIGADVADSMTNEQINDLPGNLSNRLDLIPSPGKEPVDKKTIESVSGPVVDLGGGLFGHRPDRAKGSKFYLLQKDSFNKKKQPLKITPKSKMKKKKDQ